MSPAREQPEDTFVDLTVPMIAKVGGAMAMLSGAFTLGLAIQTALVFRVRGTVGAAVSVMVILALAAVVTGWGTSRGQARSAIGAAATGGLLGPFGLAWVFAGLRSGLFSPLSFGVVALGVATAVLAGLSIGPARKVTSARNLLRAQGLDFGM